MSYSKIRLIGGPSDGRIYTAWAGEALFPVRERVPLSKAPIGPAAYNEQETVQDNSSMYQVASVHIFGRRFTYAHPVNTDPTEAFASLFPGDGFAGVSHVR